MKVSIKISYWALTGAEQWLVYRFEPKIGTVNLVGLIPEAGHCDQWSFDRYFPKILEITALSEQYITVVVGAPFFEEQRTIIAKRGETTKEISKETDRMYDEEMTSEVRKVEVTFD